MAAAPLDYEPPRARPGTNAVDFWFSYGIGVVVAYVFHGTLFDEWLWQHRHRAVGWISLASVATTTAVMAVVYWGRIRRLRRVYGLPLANLAGACAFLPAYAVLLF